MTQNYATQAVDNPVEKPKPEDKLLTQTQAYIEELAASLAQGHTEGFVEYLEVMSRFHRYSPRNQLLILLQRPTATLVAGIKRWNELGRKIQKGEKGIRILAPTLRKVEIEEENKETRELCLKVEEHLIGFHETIVFDLGQTYGKELPEAMQPKGEATEEYLGELIEACPYPVEFYTQLGTAFGATNGVWIRLRPDRSAASKVKTLFHEWAHALLHYDPNPALRPSREIAEAEAESVAYVLCRMVGLDAEETSRDYILNWGGQAEVLEASLGNIARAVKQIAKCVGV
jgi:hypothetical protein